MVNKQQNIINSVIGVVIIGLVFFMVAFYHQLNSPRVVYVNLKAAVSVPVNLAAKKLSKDKQAAFVSHYTHALGSAIMAYGKSHHVTVIAGNVLYGTGGHDVTEDIIAMTMRSVEGKA